MNDFRAASLQAWSSVAGAWNDLAAEVDRQLAVASDWMLDAVQLAPGDCVLELAAGPGTLSALAAHAVGSTGHIICSDFSPAMVEVARSRLSALADAAEIEFRVLDAEALDLPDGSVDVVLCRCGYMLMTDPAAALRESTRVLVEGGRVALAVWGDAASNPWAAMPMRSVARALDAAPPPPGAPGLWALADEDRLEHLLEAVGLSTIRVERLDATVEYPSIADWLDRVSRLAGPLRAMLAGADEATRAAIRRDLQDAAKPYEQEAGTAVLLPQRFVLATCRRMAAGDHHGVEE
jgi:SAM-dependent methyltransferase